MLSPTSRVRAILPGFFALLLPLTGTAADLILERDIADALSRAAPGQAVWLETAGQRSLALLIDSPSSGIHGGVILLHGLATHADWPQVIGPLRRRLPSRGWTTLSLQLPSPLNAKDPDELAALFERAAARIQAGVEYLRGRGIAPIVIVGHGWGATLGAAYIAGRSTGDAPLAGLIGIGMAHLEQADAGLDPARTLAALTIPVLDIHGQLDLPEVKTGAAQRSNAARQAGRGQQAPGPAQASDKVRELVLKAGSPNFRQLEVAGADHFFSQAQDRLAKHIEGWLKNYVEDRSGTLK